MFKVQSLRFKVGEAAAGGDLTAVKRGQAAGEGGVIGRGVGGRVGGMGGGRGEGVGAFHRCWRRCVRCRPGGGGCGVGRGFRRRS